MRSDALRLKLFKYSLRNNAKVWLQTQPKGSFTIWKELSWAFCNKGSPATEFVKYKNDIVSFQQQD